MNKIIALLWLLTFGNAFAGDLLELAHSKKYGVRVLVEQSRGQWCQSHIKLRFLAENKSFFQGRELQILMSKLSRLIKSECPLANSSDVYGYTNDSKKPVYQATASPVDNWQLHLKAIAVAKTPLAMLPPEEKISENNEVPSEAPSNPSLITKMNAGFSVNGWVPPENSESIAMDLGITEEKISTKDKKCVFRFTDNPKSINSKFTYIKTKDLMCQDGFVHGQGEIEVLRTDGRKLAKYKGKFSYGYFTGNNNRGQVWNVPFIKRDNRNISFLIDSDPLLKIHFLGLLTKQYDKSWVFCNRPKIVAITENEDLFLNAESIQQIITNAGSYINQYCNKMTHFEFYARNTLAATEQSKIFSIKRVTKDRSSGNWVYDPRYAQNHAMQKIEKALQKKRQEEQVSAREKQRIMEKAQYTYNALKNNINFSTRLAYLYDFSELADPYMLMAQAVLSDGPAPGILLVNVNYLDDDIAITSWPYDLKVEGINAKITNEGWHIIQGKLEIEDIQHKNEQGLPQSVFFLEKSTQCKKELCQEANELEEIIRHKFDLPDWEPMGNN